MKSFFYKHPFLYKTFIKIIHGKSFKKRSVLISELIGRNKKVFEVGCGPCVIVDFLHKSNNYIGWDLNKDFINYARNKGINAEVGDVFDFKNYPKCDVLLIIDLLHHIIPNHEKLLENCLKHSKKVIVVEPFNTNGLFDTFKNSTNPIVKFIIRTLFYFLGDNDGINVNEDMLKWNYDKEKLASFLKKFNPKKIHTMGKDLIAVFS